MCFFFEQSKFKFLQSAIVYNSFECYKAFICVHHDFPSKWSPLKKYKSYGPLQQDYSKSYHLKHLVPFSFCISSATLEYLVYVSKLPIKVLNSVSFELGPYVPRVARFTAHGPVSICIGSHFGKPMYR